MTKTIEDLLHFLILCSELLFIVLFLVFYRKAKEAPGLWVLAGYFVADIGLNYAIISASPKWAPILYTLYTLIEFTFFAWFLWLQIKNRKLKKGIIASILLFTLFSFFYYTIAHFYSLDTIPVGVETILILIFSFFYLYEQMNEPSSLFIYNKYPFWIIAGIMIYLAGSFFIYIFAYQVNYNVLNQYWMLTNVFTIVRNILAIIAILIYVKQQKNPNPKKHLYPYLN